MKPYSYVLHARDYRWDDWPGDADQVVHPHDISMMSYRGHSVMQTLIRAYFSPADTTGQRFIYAGSADGVVHVWGEAKLLSHPAVALLCLPSTAMRIPLGSVADVILTSGALPCNTTTKHIIARIRSPRF